MRPDGSFTRAIGTAIALSLIAASVGAAQTDTTRRDPQRSRIPVTKERQAPTRTPGIPVTKEPARRDSTPRVSTGEVPTPPETPAPAPQPVVQRAEARPAPAPPVAPTPQRPTRITRYLFGNSGFYLGVGGGVAVPSNQFSELGYQAGPHISVPVGWHRMGRALGLRASFAFEQAHAHTSNAPGTLPALRGSGPDPKIYSATLDATLKIPLTAMAREGRGLSLYTVAGGGAYLFRGFGGNSPLADVLGNDIAERHDEEREKNVTKWGMNVGGGLEWGFGPMALFAESRWVNVFTDGSTTNNAYLRWVPIVAGFTFR
jgi:hypothetical protein